MKYLWFLLIIISFSEAIARPISYSGGSTIMQKNGPVKNSIHLHYSPTFKYSIGYRAEYYRKNQVAINAVQLNNLAKRWNLKESQGNIYVKSGFGNANNSGNDDLVGFLGVVGDYETRRYFISYENRYYKSDTNIINQFEQSARVGIAPYLANYGSLHSWLMLQVNHIPKFEDDEIITTAFIRLFKGTYLTEFGFSSNHRILFNFIKRF